MDPLRHNHSDDASELLSAYVDGAATIAERRRAEALVERCPACAREVAELRALKSMLRELPAVQPARSFTLDPATAPHPRRLLFPTLRLATLVSAVLLFVVLGVDALGGAGGEGAATSVMSASTAAAASQQPEAYNAEAEFGTLRASAAADSAAEAAAAPAAEQAAASAAASTAAEPYAEASAEASMATEAAASTEADTAAAAASQEATAGGEQTGQASSQAPADEQPALAIRPEGSAAATSAAPPAALVAPSAAASVAPEAGGAAADTAERLDAAETSSSDTVTAAGGPAGSSSVDTLRIAEVLLALAAVALGAGALWAWRKNL